VLTIETWLQGIGLTEPIGECPAWPPDLFALAGTLIRRSGAYLRVFERRDPGNYPSEIETAANRWRQKLDGITVAAQDVKPSDLQLARIPEILQECQRVIDAKDVALSAINEHSELAEALIHLTGARG
jgi:hypothetical protein